MDKEKRKTLYLAPIMGVTDHIYRNAFFRYFGGVDYAIAPFIPSVRSRRIKPSYLKDLEPKNNCKIRLIPQILSKDPDDFVFLADRIFDLGYSEINWNLGCPTPMVAKKGRGSGLLPYPDLIKTFLDKVAVRYPGRISIKTRLGRRTVEEINTLLPIFNEFPLKSLIIHPRLGIQMYKGQADTEAFAGCIEVCRHPLVYNGDIVNLEFFDYLQCRFGRLSGWMVGRGLLANPYLALGIKGAEVAEPRFTLRCFHEELFSRYEDILWGPGHLLGKMKGIWCYLSHIFVNAHKCKKEITKIKEIKQYQQAVQRFFEEEELVSFG